MDIRLQKIVKGLAAYLQLSLEERQEFFRLYNILIQGEDVWRNSEAVRDLLNQLSSMQFKSEAETDTVLEVSTDKFFRDRLIQGKYLVQDAIYQILAQEARQNEDMCFQLFLSCDTDLSETFALLWNHGFHFSVNQLFCFPTADNDCSQSVSILKQIIPLCLIARDSYHPYYFYEHPDSLSVNPLNYYIITAHYLILLSQDQSTALIQCSENLISYYFRHFQALKDHCEPVVSFTSTLTDILEISNNMVHPKGFLYLMPQPCFSRYYTPEIIAKYLKGDDASTGFTYESILAHFALLQSVESNFYTIFTEEGLQNFIKNGVITELPQKYVRPIEKQDRILFLSQLSDDIAAERINGRIVRSSALHIPEYLNLYVDSEGDTWFYTTSDFIYGAYSCNIHIAEKSIDRAFGDFFQSLPGSQMVYSLEETVSILNEYIRNLKCL